MTLILTTIRYGFSWLRMNYYGGMAQFSYRTSFIAAALTYGIVVYKTQRARAKTGGKPEGPIGLLADENVQYLSTSLNLSRFTQLPLLSCLGSLNQLACFQREASHACSQY